MERKINISLENMTPTIVKEILELEKENETLIKETSLNGYLEDSSVLVITAREKSRLIGFLVGKILVDTIDLEYILVDKNFRKINIASSILDYLSAIATKRHIYTIMLEVRVSNEAAINLYKKGGFNIINTRFKYYKEGLEDALVMQKILS